MTREAVQILDIDRIAAAELIKEIRDKKFELARDRSPLEEAVAAEAESLAGYLVEADTRTCCILAVSFLEDTLKKNFIEKWDIAGKEAYNTYFGSNGPICTLSQRALVARAIGWIPEAIGREIDALRKIRNEFAHNHRIHTLVEEPLQSYASRLEERDRTWDRDDATPYRAAYRQASRETQLRMRVYCCVLVAVSHIMARSKLIVYDVDPNYREGGFRGLTGIEQDLIDTMVRYCLFSLKIERTGL